MKIIIALIIALHAMQSYAQPKKTDLQYPMMLAYSVVQETDPVKQKQKLTDYLKDQDIVSYIKVRKDEAALELRLNNLLQQLKQKTEKLSQPVQVEYQLDIANYDEQTNELSFSKPITDNAFTVGSISQTVKGFPQFFHIILINDDVFDNTYLINKKYRDDTQLLRSGNTVYLSLEVSLLDLPQDNHALAGISSMKIYATDKKQKLLHEFKEKRDLAQLRDAHFLSEGVTNSLTGIHSFSFYGYRMLDWIVKDEISQKNCKKNGRIGIHQRITCTESMLENYFMDAEIELDFVGGRLADLKIYAVGPFTRGDTINLIGRITDNLFITKAKLAASDLVKWSRYLVDFTFHNKALNEIIVDELPNETQVDNDFQKVLILEIFPQQMKPIYDNHEGNK